MFSTKCSKNIENGLKKIFGDFRCGPGNWKVMLPGSGNTTILLGGQAHHQGEGPET